MEAYKGNRPELDPDSLGTAETGSLEAEDQDNRDMAHQCNCHRASDCLVLDLGEGRRLAVQAEGNRLREVSRPPEVSLVVVIRRPEESLEVAVRQEDCRGREYRAYRSLAARDHRTLDTCHRRTCTLAAVGQDSLPKEGRTLDSRVHPVQRGRQSVLGRMGGTLGLASLRCRR